MTDKPTKLEKVSGKVNKCMAMYVCNSRYGIDCSFSEHDDTKASCKFYEQGYCTNEAAQKDAQNN